MTDVSKRDADLQALTELLNQVTPLNGFYELVKDYLNVTRATEGSGEQTCLFAQPSICIVPQGAKSFSVLQDGKQHIEDKTNMVVYSAEVPISFRIIDASKSQPYFCLMIPLHTERLRELGARVFANGLPKAEKLKAVYINDIDHEIVKIAVRLMETIAKQEAVNLLVPHLIDEILIRLLLSPIGADLVQLGVSGSHADKIVKAITWIKQNYAESFSVTDLAKLTGMSASSFHSHFKSVTSMSPLQYQKMVRLQEARSLIQSRIMDVSRVAYEVGYTSTSQFSREYSRAYGLPPSRESAIKH